MAESGSCEAEKRPEVERIDELKEEEAAEDGDVEAEGESEVGELRGVELVSGAEVRETQSEALAAVVVNDRRGGMLDNSTSELRRGSVLKIQTEKPNQEALPSSTKMYDEVQTQNELQLSKCSPAKPEGYLLEQKVIDTTITEANLQNSPGERLSVIPVLKTPVSDGYNWRKYGQKQVKSPTGSRSYYKCTYSECLAKKIECSDHTGHIIEIVNKGLHSHDPPRKSNYIRESRIVSSARPVLENCVTQQSIRMPDDSEASTSPKELNPDANEVSEKKRKYSSCSDKYDETPEEENTREPELKKRVKKDDMASPGSIPVKKPKIVVHAAGHVGISSDGYRWRKYGQKMVKGNSHPRNYYRCTSAGCPVRKHIETAVDNSDAVIITYKGAHDHDMPVPKKRQGPPSALIAATTPATMQLTKTDTTENQITSTQWTVGTAGELTGESLDLGGDKAMESARTLLSIGFEIKPC